jgi:hypothetical protein
VLCDNEVRPVPGEQDLDEAILSLAEAAVEVTA